MKILNFTLSHSFPEIKHQFRENDSHCPQNCNCHSYKMSEYSFIYFILPELLIFFSCSHTLRDVLSKLLNLRCLTRFGLDVPD